jgi:hypothetical protein
VLQELRISSSFASKKIDPFEPYTLGLHRDKNVVLVKQTYMSCWLLKGLFPMIIQIAKLTVIHPAFQIPVSSLRRSSRRVRRFRAGLLLQRKGLK